MTAALQTRMPLPTERITVLLNVHCVRALLELNEDETLALARMEWGFDVSSGAAKRIDLRVLPAVVTNFLVHGGTKRLDWDWERVRKELVRGSVRTATIGAHEAQYIEGTTAQLILNCSSTHLNSFLACRQLRVVPGTPEPKPGPNGTPKITAESFLEFLRKRRVR
jgi:hypothetical protein